MSQGRVNGLGTHPYELPPSQSVPSDAYTNQRGLRGFNSKMNLEVLIGLTILDLPDDRRCLDEIVAP